jgi:hypothetical protein
MLMNDEDARVGNMVAGASDYLSVRHKKFFHIMQKSFYPVPCRPFGVILNELGITHIDLLSLDVEGAEEIVLRTMDWSIPIHVILIEAHEYNSPTGKQGHECKHRILLENGFKLVTKTSLDEIWVNPENSKVTSRNRPAPPRSLKKGGN